MDRLSNKFTYANVVSTLCLILVVGGGTAFAASHLGKESVGTRQLKKEAVTPIKLSSASKAALTGPTGPQGPQGPKGDAGTNGLTKQTLIAVTETGTAGAQCNPGEHLTGGGAIDNGAGTIKSSYPNTAINPNEPSGHWTAIASNAGDSVTVRILCASP